VTARVDSVNVGTIVDVPWGRVKRSAIDKQPATGPIAVHSLGLGGDEIADLEHHGGLDQAVYAFAREDLDDWAAELGRELANGQFGENLTTQGIDLTESRAGDRWRIGEVLFEISGVRIPCSVFQGFLDEKQWVKRFTQHGRPGPYLRVVEPGVIQAGDALEVVEQRDHDLTVGLVFRALTTEPDLIDRLDEEPRLAAFVERRLGSRVRPGSTTR
jgi:MOSC domain-containing protein YiiM